MHNKTKKIISLLLSLVMVLSVTLNGEPYEPEIVNDNGKYSFTVAMAPAQIADPIVVTVGDETLPTTSVMDYCLALCNSKYNDQPKVQNLAKAILHYGKAAKNCFGA